jgi:hypothetical protein
MKRAFHSMRLQLEERVFPYFIKFISEEASVKYSICGLAMMYERKKTKIDV